MVEIRLKNTKTRTVERFEPLDPKNVRMYVCGPTVYDRAHLGNARPVVVFDVLFRLLRQVYGANAVTYVRNFTDVEDKINARAAETGRPISEITEETIGWYLDDMGALGTLEPTHMPRATDYIQEMVDMIADLVAKGHAYEAEGHVLFRVRSYEAYGALSGRSVDDMIAGARVEVAPYKEDPMDFVLWKPSTEDLPGWDSPWGRGRPGWHIECSAMSYELLGESFDIHGGGIDLQFPHHENEIAQSCCAHPGGGFAKVWMHNEMLQVEGKKMSKSLGNFFTVRDLLDQGVPGEVIRFVFLHTHYRKPMDWTEKKAKEAQATLRKWRTLTAGTEPAASASAVVIDALADDLNTAGAVTELYRLATAGDAAGLLASARLMGLLTDELGAWFAAEQEIDKSFFATEVDALMALRSELKAIGKDRFKLGDREGGEEAFAWSDKAREACEEFGFAIMDLPDRYEWELGPKLRRFGIVNTSLGGQVVSTKTKADLWGEVLKRLKAYRLNLRRHMEERDWL
ncbi:cysteine--tRNA ligase [Roseobacter sp. HKCCD9010]|uniref:cysteine--tRNA ligase n=1 Tax=unclassified Roseobacter TaxID=196798 RepID=UPI0014920231|nr:MULTISPECIES: cysteine--tRNA ligase [unclassified Roseobacter]MBF9050182.1 cysteine--tRNA ligase [Rhodobacterales bacterium HKCCD4356]NNV12425.1 cysteine--tRNA ligase [Roseobacter sp. HKCCD7357]NNV16111.1 cysteine--tRNA ligase [Roseobacter sp. HKCCD8768]NNV25571.1 cysteine--tRNA ligase [Roseobacter sp. HKCCD8192]NNV29827.1 cysteine--tRNA ligase [Roseobacter sp. HKCCD9061]